MMQVPSTLLGAVVWVVCLVVLALVAVFLFREIVLPILTQVT